MESDNTFTSNPMSWATEEAFGIKFKRKKIDNRNLGDKKDPKAPSMLKGKQPKKSLKMAVQEGTCGGRAVGDKRTTQDPRACENVYPANSSKDMNPHHSGRGLLPTHHRDQQDMNPHHSGGGLLPTHHRDQQGTCFVQLYAHQEIFQSEKWKPNGSTLYRPLSSRLLVNFEKYDQISFDEGLFFIGDEKGGCLQKEEGHVIHCWRFDDKEKTLFIAMSYLFTDFCVFEEIANRFNYA